MGERRLRLKGFQKELAGIIAAGFRFEDDDLKDYALSVGRNLFASDLPASEDIAVTASASDNGMEFDGTKEPAIAIYRQPGGGIQPSSSSGGRLAFNELFVLRAPKALDDAVDLLDELVVWLEKNIIGRTSTHYKICGVQTLGLPVPIQRLGNDQSAASATVRFLAVALS